MEIKKVTKVTSIVITKCWSMKTLKFVSTIIANKTKITIEIPFLDNRFYNILTKHIHTLLHILKLSRDDYIKLTLHTQNETKQTTNLQAFSSSGFVVVQCGVCLTSKIEEDYVFDLVQLLLKLKQYFWTKGQLCISTKLGASCASQIALSLHPRGGTCSIHDGAVQRIFGGLKIYILGIFWGQEICHIFF